MKRLAYVLQSEGLQKANDDSTVFGPEEEWKELMGRSKTAFQKAKALDPDNEHAQYWHDA